MLIAFLCIAFSAQAARVTDLSQLSNDKVYTIRSARAFLLYSANVQTLASSNGQSVGAVKQDPQDPNQQFKIENKGGSYYLYSVGAGKYVVGSGQYNVNALSVLKITASGNATYPWKLGLGNFYLNSQEAGQTPAGLVIDGWSTTDAGNCYQIIEATEETETGIDNAGFTMQDSQLVYDLQGRLVSNPTKGIYIQGGKKIVLR